MQARLGRKGGVLIQTRILLHSFIWWPTSLQDCRPAWRHFIDLAVARVISLAGRTLLVVHIAPIETPRLS